MLKRKALQSYGGGGRARGGARARARFKVSRREFTTLSGLQHMELFIGEFFLRSLCCCITIDVYSTTSTTAGFNA